MTPADSSISTDARGSAPIESDVSGEHACACVRGRALHRVPVRAGTDWKSGFNSRVEARICSTVLRSRPLRQND